MADPASDSGRADSPRRRAATSVTNGTGTRRTGKRQSIIDGTERLMIAEGYGAVTFRSVATAAGVVPGLVQYYFPALGDLFVAVLRQATDRLIGELADATQYEHPLRAVWAYASDPAGSALLMQFMALANQEPKVKEVIGEGGERVRQALLKVVSSSWSDYGLDAELNPPAAALFVLSAIARMAHFEEAMGTTTGHAEAFELVERFLDRVEPRTARNSDSPDDKPSKVSSTLKKETHKQKATRDARH